MCGIAGFWSREALGGDEARCRVLAMRDAIAHRGPDEAGVWIEGPVAFGHRRLSILDLSPLGRQPMSSADGRWTICYNGEVFNFQALRSELVAKGHAFRGHSDTEVMLAALVEWGMAGAVDRFVGMFAFAAWDAQERTLHLVRDRLGVKPLYVGRTPAGDLIFGSELKSLMAYPGFDRRLRPEAVLDYLRYSYVPSPQCIFADVVKLLPGHRLELRSPADPLAPMPYWELERVARDGRAHPFRDGAEAAEAALHDLLREAVRIRMISDVPLGAFLSGGIDSSLVVALMQAQSDRPVRTFTIGFAEPRYDESAHARAVAAHLGTDHTEQRVTPEEALAVIPSLPTMYDEPLADASQVPTYLVSALARRHVTVALSGDGGDEFFGGYERYRFAPRAWERVRLVPGALRAPLAGALGRAARSGALGGSARRARKLAELLRARSADDLYRGLVSTDRDPERLMLSPRRGTDRLGALLTSDAASHPVQRMMLADAAVYLPDDLLTKLDRASMAVALEGREPLLDHRVAELAWRLPLELRTGKTLLKRVLSRYVPRALFERPKMGFEVPIRDWLRGPLRSWSEALLDPAAIRTAGIFDPAAIRRVLDEHLAGTRDSAHLLWSLLMFESWRAHWDARL